MYKIGGKKLYKMREIRYFYRKNVSNLIGTYFYIVWFIYSYVLYLITIKLVLADKSEKVFEIKTTALTLADALLEEKLISKDEYDAGFYTTINGVRADYNLDKMWWCINVNGEMAMAGMKEIALTDGGKYELVFTVGYDFF